MKYIDLFAGAGGFSEGFFRAGFTAIAHVEMNHDAVNTIKTRLAYNYLNKKHRLDEYYDYLSGLITREQLYEKIPSKIHDTVIQLEMKESNLQDLFKKIDNLKKNTEVDLIIGGPPCQGYSLAGRAKQKRIAVARMNGSQEDDDRKYLYKIYCDVLKKYQPKLFVFENVVGLLSADEGKHWLNIYTLFNQTGYYISHKILNSKDFGVPQERKRIIVIGWKKGSTFRYPEFNSYKINWTLKDILSDLPRISAGESSNKYSSKPIHEYVSKHLRDKCDILTHHSARRINDRDKSIYRIAVEKMNEGKRLKYSELPLELKTHKNEKDFVDRFKVIPSTLAHCHTILAHISKDGHYYIHYDKDQARSITVREAARIQSFPDNYFFEGSRTSAFIQIGNAVPPLMSEKIAKKLKMQLLNEGKYGDV